MARNILNQSPLLHNIHISSHPHLHRTSLPSSHKYTCFIPRPLLSSISHNSLITVFLYFTTEDKPIQQPISAISSSTSNPISTTPLSVFLPSQPAHLNNILLLPFVFFVSPLLGFFPSTTIILWSSCAYSQHVCMLTELRSHWQLK